MRVLDRFRDWKEWRKTHEDAWRGLTEPDLVGITEFQRICSDSLAQDLPGVTFEESGGNRELYLLGDVPNSDFTIYIYRAGAEALSTRREFRYESTDFLAPKDLISRLVQDVRGAI